MSSFKKDYTFGISKQNELLPLICDRFGLDIKNIEYQYSKFDYKDETNNINFELKSRRCKSNDYDTTMIPKDKLESNGLESKLILLFNFTDGTYFIEYNKLLFDTFEHKLFKRNDRYDYYDIEKTYIYIPIKYLQKI